MKHLLDSLQSSLVLSPVGIAVELPGGQRLGNGRGRKGFGHGQQAHTACWALRLRLCGGDSLPQRCQTAG